MQLSLFLILQAIFEVISSEHSYLLSLEILIRMFKNSKELSLTMTKTESHHLFSNIADVYEASKKFFKELEAKHQNNIFIDDISDIVGKHAASTFDPYVKYCTNEVYQQRTLQKLLATNPAFKEVLSRIESHEDCRNLPMISFLILPMQRVTRLPLLMDVRTGLFSFISHMCTCMFFYFLYPCSYHSWDCRYWSVENRVSNVIKNTYNVQSQQGVALGCTIPSSQLPLPP
uniref:DH domain-containing protein n=1 Tax=Nothoprocta perdicaria TaxID=30464 RepID=A0A8C7E8B7_NOTPE